MGPSVYQSDCRTYRKWKIRLCQEICTQYPTYDDPNTESHLVVLWRISDFIRNRTWSGLSTRFTGLEHPQPQTKHLIILDDLMDETDQRVSSLFTKKSHHRNISVMYFAQNLFHRGKHHRTISLNAHFMVVFKNPRDVSQIMALAHQMYPRRTQFFLEAFARATARPHGYMVIDMKQNTPDILRLRTFIFPGEEQKAYVES